MWEVTGGLEAGSICGEGQTDEAIAQELLMVGFYTHTYLMTVDSANFLRHFTDSGPLGKKIT